METLYVKNRNCPFCGKKLIYQNTKCPNSIVLPCLECKSCEKYLYTEPYYNVLFQLAKNANRNINKNVYKYQNYIEELPHIKNKHKKTKSKKIKKENYKKLERNKNYNVHFKKRGEQLVLIIRIPLNQKELRLIKNTYIFEFKSNLKDKKISIKLLLKGLDAKNKLFSNDFDINIHYYLDSLNIILDKIPEITKNETPYNKLDNRIFIERYIYNNNGSLDLKIWINKEFIASSIIPLYKNLTKSSEKTQDNSSIKKSNSKKKKGQPQKSSKSLIQKHNKSIINYNIKTIKQDVGITAIVINDTRGCIYNEHFIKDIIAVLRIGTTSGDIKNYSIQAGYCNECDKYYILKKDFKFAKKFGAVLCPVIDLAKNKDKKQYETQIVTTESKIHQLGYNVIKKNKYTTKQRQLILANIIENTDISKHEIKSNIERCIKQHQTQPNYVEAVACWKADYDFVSNYELGDMPQVKVDRIIIK